MLRLGENHQYTSDDAPWIEYHGVTRVKKTVERPYDSKVEAMRLVGKPDSSYYGEDVQQVLHKWDEARKQGQRRGNMLHDCAYRYFSKDVFKASGSQYGFDEVLLPHLGVLRDRYRLENRRLSCEKDIDLKVMLYDKRWANCLDKLDNAGLREEVSKCSALTGREWPSDWPLTVPRVKKFLCWLGLCGTPDLVDVHDAFFDVHDFKSDDAIRTKGFYVRGGYGKTEKLLQPLGMLENCNYELYCIQVHLYGIMLEKKLGIPMRMGYIHHWDDRQVKFNSMIVWDRREHARALLHQYFQKLAA